MEGGATGSGHDEDVPALEEDWGGRLFACRAAQQVDTRVTKAIICINA